MFNGALNRFDCRTRLLWRLLPHLARVPVLAFLALAPTTLVAASTTTQTQTESTSTDLSDSAPARQLYNEGSHWLAKTNWRAEPYLKAALKDDRFLNPALYNLGHIHFNAGLEELKKGPSGKSTVSKARETANHTDQVIKDIDNVLGSAGGSPSSQNAQPAEPPQQDENLNKLLQSYMQGRGARKEIKAAMRAIKIALETHGKTLVKWQRSSGDFKSAVEVVASDVDARHNADVVDRTIAKLIDSIREMEAMAAALGQKKDKLDGQMKQLKGKMPGGELPPGAPGDDDEEDEQSPFGKQPGEEAGQKKDEKKETGLTPEQAAWLLEGYKLDSERRLPMTITEGKETKPNDRSRPTW